MSHINHEILHFYILVIYASVNSPQSCSQLFSDLLYLSKLLSFDDQSILERLIIAGDFNYDTSGVTWEARSTYSGLSA